MAVKSSNTLGAASEWADGLGNPVFQNPRRDRGIAPLTRTTTVAPWHVGFTSTTEGVPDELLPVTETVEPRSRWTIYGNGTLIRLADGSSVNVNG